MSSQSVLRARVAAGPAVAAGLVSVTALVVLAACAGRSTATPTTGDATDLRYPVASGLRSYPFAASRTTT